MDCEDNFLNEDFDHYIDMEMQRYKHEHEPLVIPSTSLHFGSNGIFYRYGADDEKKQVRTLTICKTCNYCFNTLLHSCCPYCTPFYIHKICASCDTLTFHKWFTLPLIRCMTCGKDNPKDLPPLRKEATQRSGGIKRL